MVVMAAPILALPRFIKVIHDHEQQKETRIPMAVANKHWKGLSNPIVLKLPNGDDGWKVFWEKRDDGIWLHENWENFAKLCSLRFGSLLVFDHKGASSFQVSIFDPNTIERTYDSEGRHDVDSVQILETPPLKKKKTESNGEPESPPSERTKNNGKRKINVDIDATQQEVSGAKRGVGMLKAKNCSKAEAIKEISRNHENPSCVVIMTGSYLQYHVVIPSGFSRKNLYGLEGTATIGIGEDLTSTWDVSLKFDRGRERTRLGNGWKSFCQDNNLQVGDSCIFELINSKPTFKVHVKPSSEQGDGHEANKNKREKGAVENMECFDNSSPRNCRNVTRVLGNSGSPNMKPDKFEISVNTNYPSIPQEFMKKYNTIHGNYVKLKVGKSSWDVKVLKYPQLTRFSDGWRAFVRECELNVGDTCVFEMVNEKKLELQVSINKYHH